MPDDRSRVPLPPPAGPAPAPTPGIVQAWTTLSVAQKRTAVATVVLFLSLLTPWYATKAVLVARTGSRPQVSEGTMSGFSAFSFVEAAILVTVVALLLLTWGRATGRRFSLPAYDGTLVVAAAGWIGLLIVIRLFVRPGTTDTATSTTLVGLSWGIFASLAAAGLLLTTGLDQRRRALAGNPAAGEPPTSVVPRRHPPEGHQLPDEDELTQVVRRPTPPEDEHDTTRVVRRPTPPEADDATRVARRPTPPSDPDDATRVVRRPTPPD